MGNYYTAPDGERVLVTERGLAEQYGALVSVKVVIFRKRRRGARGRGAARRENLPLDDKDVVPFSPEPIEFLFYKVVTDGRIGWSCGLVKAEGNDGRGLACIVMLFPHGREQSLALLPYPGYTGDCYTTCWKMNDNLSGESLTGSEIVHVLDTATQTKLAGAIAKDAIRACTRMAQEVVIVAENDGDPLLSSASAWVVRLVEVMNDELFMLLAELESGRQVNFVLSEE